MTEQALQLGAGCPVPGKAGGEGVAEGMHEGPGWHPGSNPGLLIELLDEILQAASSHAFARVGDEQWSVGSDPSREAQQAGFEVVGDDLFDLWLEGNRPLLAALASHTNDTVACRPIDGPDREVEQFAQP